MCCELSTSMQSGFDRRVIVKAAFRANGSTRRVRSRLRVVAEDSRSGALVEELA